MIVFSKKLYKRGKLLYGYTPLEDFGLFLGQKINRKIIWFTDRGRKDFQLFLQSIKNIRGTHSNGDVTAGPHEVFLRIGLPHILCFSSPL